MAPPFTLILSWSTPELVREVQRHGGEGLVDLEQIDVADGHAGLLQGLLRRGHGLGEHEHGLAAGGDDGRMRARGFRPEALADGLVADEHAAEPSTMPLELPAVWMCRMCSMCG
jgi:hypothetical protein